MKKKRITRNNDRMKEIRSHNRLENNPSYSRMTFGRYFGYYLKDVPENYLCWLIGNWQSPGTAGYTSAILEFYADELLRRPQWRQLNITARRLVEEIRIIDGEQDQNDTAR